MILQLLFISLCGTLAQSLSKGEFCRLENGDYGNCTTLDHCRIIDEQLLADNLPDTICGYDSHYAPIVCCPLGGTRMPKRLEKAPRVIKGDGRGEISRQKCAEYSKFVYTLKYTIGPYTGTRRTLNVSQCATKAPKLIFGGEKAEQKEFPHMAAIGYGSERSGITWRCGGSIISENFVLTAAHCTYSQESGDAVLVRVGDLNLERTDDGANPVDIRIVDRIRHPDYKAPATYHDIALLRLETAIRFNGWARPACLHTEPDTGTEKAIATGWGLVEPVGNKGSSDLLKVTLPLVSSQYCSIRWAYVKNDVSVSNGINGEWSICAGETGKDTCRGDSGGPLVVFNKAQHCMYDIVGVTSIGQFCGTNMPAIYSRVYHYVPWIESIVWPRG